MPNNIVTFIKIMIDNFFFLIIMILCKEAAISFISNLLLLANPQKKAVTKGDYYRKGQNNHRQPCCRHTAIDGRPLERNYLYHLEQDILANWRKKYLETENQNYLFSINIIILL